MASPALEEAKLPVSLTSETKLPVSLTSEQEAKRASRAQKKEQAREDARIAREKEDSDMTPRFEIVIVNNDGIPKKVIKLKSNFPTDEKTVLMNHFPTLREFRFPYIDFNIMKTNNLVPRTKYIDMIYKAVDEEVNNIKESVKKAVEEGEISYEQLEYFYLPGNVVTYHTEDGDIEAAVITKLQYENSIFSGQYLGIDAYSYAHNGVQLITANKYFTVGNFKGKEKIDNLSLKHIDDSNRELLIKRGQRYVDLSKGFHHLYCHGKVSIQTFFGTIYQNVSGKCMVDLYTHSIFSSKSNGSKQSSGNLVHVLDFILTILPSRIWIYSFPKKMWGEARIDDLTPIKFNKDAYNYLVHDENTKTFIRKLVSSAHKNSFTDFVEKGGGLVFRLSGPPGVGKTLTAETVSELLEKPLFTISSGELGASVEKIEENLSKYLKLASIWGAMILLDEADVFLQRRDGFNLQKNAIVSIFLREIEYYKGILFLTTNRSMDIDEAFESRITVSLEYNELTKDDKLKIIRNLLKASNFEANQEDIDLLSEKIKNGRQIKSHLIVSQSLMNASKGTDEEITFAEAFHQATIFSRT